MAYFKLNLLTKVFNNENDNQYIKNIISEFYGNNKREELLRYEKVLPETSLSNKIQLNNVYTKTYTYNEKLTLHQQGQKELTFSLDKMVLDDDVWKENPFASKIKNGSQLLLEDKYNNLMSFIVKNIGYNITENNIIYTFTCQDTFSFLLSKQNDGYTIKNDIDSKDFIGALTIDSWAKKIVEDCKISYKYLNLATPLFLCTDGTATTFLDANKKVLKTLKDSYINNSENSDLYETIPFSCSSTSANGALISLGEQIGLSINTATVLKSEENGNFIELVTYFWYEPSKKDAVSGLMYSPFRDIKSFNLSQNSDSLLTVLNINSRTLSSDVELTPLSTVSPFFMNSFNSTYWKKYSKYSVGLYSDILYGPVFSADSTKYELVSIQTLSGLNNNQIGVYISGQHIWFYKEITEEEKEKYSLYDKHLFEKDKISTEIVVQKEGEYIYSLRNTIFNLGVEQNEGKYFLYIDFSPIDTVTFAQIKSVQLVVFFKTEYNDEDEQFAKIADQLPYLENKLIDLSYFVKNNLISKIQEKDINNRIYNDLRKVNSDILMNASVYYNRIHKQTQYLADMTNNIDAVGAEVSNIVNIYKEKGSNDNYDTNRLYNRWNLLQYSISGAAPASKTDISGSYATVGFVDLYDTVSDYMRKFLNARQRCLKNLYNFRQYFDTALDDRYKNLCRVTITIEDKNEPKNIYRFTPINSDKYSVFDQDFANNHKSFFSWIDDDEGAKITDYHNLVLYNNDKQHTIFDKDNYLITKTNYNNMNFHMYQDILKEEQPYSRYDSDIQYLRKVCFIRRKTLLKLFGINEDTAIEQFDLKIGTNNERDCEIKVYDRDSNYFVCNKMFEDGNPFNNLTLFANSKIWANGQQYKTDVNQSIQYIICLDKHVLKTDTNEVNLIKADTINFAEDFDSEYVYRGNIFYQPIDQNDILMNFLWRKRSSYTLYKSEPFRYNSLDVLLENNSVNNYTFETLDDPGAYDPDGGVVDFVGWGVNTETNTNAWWWTNLAISLGSNFLGLPLFGLVDQKHFSHNVLSLVLGSYDETSSIKSQILSDWDFGSFNSRDNKKRSWYIYNYPLDEYFVKESNDISDDNASEEVSDVYTSKKIPTSASYQNFYTMVKAHRGEQNFSLANHGTFCDSSESIFIGKSTQSLFDHFVSEFPQYKFYFTEPDVSKPALSFGNLIYEYQQNQSFADNLYYKQTKTYKIIDWQDLDRTDTSCRYLVVEENTIDTEQFAIPNELNQYIHYDIIQNSQIMTIKEILNRWNAEPDCTFYLIIDSVIEEVTLQTTKEDFYNSTIVNNHCKKFKLSDLYDEPELLQHLYHIEEKVKVNPKSTDYDLYNHLLDNKYELYNDNEERVYTINQLFGNLTYKDAQKYSFYVFDKSIPQDIKLYRYNNASTSPDIIWYSFDISSSKEEATGYKPYEDFKYSIDVASQSVEINTNTLTNGSFWYYFTVKDFNTQDDYTILREHAAMIESTLQQYWNEAYASSLLCDIFVPEEWRIKQEQVENNFNVIIKSDIEDDKFDLTLNSLYIPLIDKIKDKQYLISWGKEPISLENSEIYSYDDLSPEQQSEVNIIINHTQNVATDYLFFTKISDNTSYYSIQDGGCDWATFLNSCVGVYLPHYTGWNGIAINYLTSHFIDYGKSEYESLLERRNNMWRELYNDYPYLFLEGSFSSESATTPEQLLTMAKYDFEDKKYPEKSYSISLIDLVQDVETVDKKDTNTNTYTYNPSYYYGIELHIGESIKIDATDYVDTRDDVYEALSNLLFITDIIRDLRNDGDCQLTVNTIKYKDKLIRRLAKLIKKNPLN